MTQFLCFCCMGSYFSSNPLSFNSCCNWPNRTLNDRFPSTFYEFYPLIRLLTHPTSGEDPAFTIVIPSLPGCLYSDPLDDATPNDIAAHIGCVSQHFRVLTARSADDQHGLPWVRCAWHRMGCSRCLQSCRPISRKLRCPSFGLADSSALPFYFIRKSLPFSSVEATKSLFFWLWYQNDGQIWFWRVSKAFPPFPFSRSGLHGLPICCSPFCIFTPPLHYRFSRQHWEHIYQGRTSDSNLAILVYPFTCFFHLDVLYLNKDTQLISAASSIDSSFICLGVSTSVGVAEVFLWQIVQTTSILGHWAEWRLLPSLGNPWRTVADFASLFRAVLNKIHETTVSSTFWNFQRGLDLLLESVFGMIVISVDRLLSKLVKMWILSANTAQSKHVIDNLSSRLSSPKPKQPCGRSFSAL